MRVPVSMRRQPLPRTGVEGLKLRKKKTRRQGASCPSPSLESSPSAKPSASRRVRPQSARPGFSHRRTGTLRDHDSIQAGDVVPARTAPRTAPRPISLGSGVACVQRSPRGRISHDGNRPTKSSAGESHYKSSTQNSGIAKVPVLTPLSQQSAAVFASHLKMTHHPSPWFAAPQTAASRLCESAQAQPTATPQRSSPAFYNLRRHCPRN